jgi:hypothetical protein
MGFSVLTSGASLTDFGCSFQGLVLMSRFRERRLGAVSSPIISGPWAADPIIYSGIS